MNFSTVKNKFNILTLSTVALPAILLSGCSYANDYWSKYESRENATKLRVGMTKTEVIGIMGDPIDNNFGYKDIIFYYTKTEWHDFQITIDETFPVVFDKNDMVVGFGPEYFQNNVLFKQPESTTEK